jgi:hypothetical protein
MPVHGKEEHEREMAELAAATPPADLAPFSLPGRRAFGIWLMQCMQRLQSLSLIFRAPPS